jgi:hypothetical protein
MIGRAVLLACLLSPAALASPERAQRLIGRGEFRDALEVARLDVLRNPGSNVAKYNYAVAAYAAGIYGAANDALKTLTTSADAEMSLRSYFQLGNTSFRIAERMETENPLAAAQRFEESIKYFAFASAQPGATQSLAVANETLSHERAAQSFLTVARGKVIEGDRAARINPEEGFPGWEGSLEFFDQAKRHAPEDVAIRQEKENVLTRLATQSYTLGSRYLQQGRIQERYVVPRALDLYRKAIGFFEKSGKYAHPSSAQGLADAKGALGTGLLRYTREQLALAENHLTRSAAASLEALGKVSASLAEAEELGVDPVAVGAARRTADDLWFRAHHARGDEQVSQAGMQPAHSGEQIESLVGALSSYAQALRYRAEDATVQEKHHAVRLRLSDLYEHEGRELLATARAKAESKLEEALAAAEKSVQSFVRAIDYHRDNERAQQGLAEAEAFLEELRRRFKEDERKTAKKSKDEMKEPKDLKDLPKDVALKLLDYRNNNPAAKLPQMITAPENQPLQDW